MRNKIILLLGVFAFTFFNFLKIAKAEENIEEQVEVLEVVEEKMIQQISEDEYYSFIENDSISTRSLFKEIAVSLRILWIDHDGNRQPAYKATIEVVENDVNFNERYNCCSDINGNIYLLVKTDFFSGADLSINLVLDNDCSKVIDDNENVYRKDNVFSIQDVKENVDFGEYIIDAYNANATEFEEAFQIFQASNWSAKYADYLFDFTNFPQTTIKYYSKKGGCYYSSSLDMIHICKNPSSQEGSLKPFESWDVIMHEYGHFITHIKGYMDCMYGGEHFFSESICDTQFKNNGELDEFLLESKEYGNRVAWNEGLATAFAFMAQNYSKQYIGSIYSVGNYLYEAYNLKNGQDVFNTNIKHGEGHELLTARLILDLSDEIDLTGNYDDYDYFDFTDAEVWNYISLNEDNTLSGFVQVFYDMYLNDGTQRFNKFNFFISQYELSKINLLSDRSFSFATNSSQFYKNNHFELMVYNIRGEFLFSRNITDVSYYSLSDSEYKMIIDEGYREYKIFVKSRNDVEGVEGFEYYSREYVIKLANKQIAFDKFFFYKEEITKNSSVDCYLKFEENISLTFDYVYNGRYNFNIYLYDRNGNLLNLNSQKYYLNGLKNEEYKLSIRNLDGSQFKIYFVTDNSNSNVVILNNTELPFTQSANLNANESLIIEMDILAGVRYDIYTSGGLDTKINIVFEDPNEETIFMDDDECEDYVDINPYIILNSSENKKIKIIITRAYYSSYSNTSINVNAL